MSKLQRIGCRIEKDIKKESQYHTDQEHKLRRPDEMKRLMNQIKRPRHKNQITKMTQGETYTILNTQRIQGEERQTQS